MYKEGHRLTGGCPARAYPTHAFLEQVVLRTLHIFAAITLYRVIPWRTVEADHICNLQMLKVQQFQSPRVMFSTAPLIRPLSSHSWSVSNLYTE